ncbi:MAG: 50S ribosomal protein L15 [Bacteroidota bacterium]
MKLHSLKPAPNAITKRKRIGRGEGSKKGGTSTKGHKGQQSRAGYSRKPAFEGGQTPYVRRVPKFGGLKRKNPPHTPINLAVIADYATKHKTILIDLAFYIKTGLLSKKTDTCKILGDAEKLPEKLEISAHGFSKKAQAAIEKNGGTIHKL